MWDQQAAHLPMGCGAEAGGWPAGGPRAVDAGTEHVLPALGRHRVRLGQRRAHRQPAVPIAINGTSGPGHFADADLLEVGNTE